MCPHEFYLGTCTCIFRKIKPRGVGVGVEYGGVRVWCVRCRGRV